MKQLLESLNSFQNAPENYLAALSETHRTIQQLFFRLVRQCVLYMAEPGNVIIDDRNRASYHLCQKIADQMRDHHLPII